MNAPTMNKVYTLKALLEKYTRHSCPEQFYRAWKVLVLNTNEYKNQEVFSIIFFAIQKIDDLIFLIEMKEANK